ncbi:hypothetical protein BY458DRAFT_137622 [Sporodiniella umbellata]|nr:hypothetical protein BY458DRAFT_137622 [Sporodiniella umbellata]
MKSYKPISAIDIKLLKLSPSGIRIVPKSNGFRIITHLRDKSKAFSTNKILKPILQILSFEKEQQPDAVGSSVQAHELFEKLKLYKNQIKLLKNERLYLHLKKILTSEKYIHRYADICRFFSDGTHSKSITHITGTTGKINK